MRTTWSWGNLPKAKHKLHFQQWTSNGLPEVPAECSILPYGKGRSYGDVPINDENALLVTTGLDRFIRFDTVNGVLECESGVTFEQIIKLVLPQGWFLPVTPGTQHLTVGGAIANDVHGKNHFHNGTFGCHIASFNLLRSDKGLLRCSDTENSELFSATIGGLGLTGVIVSAEIQLKKICSSTIVCREIPFDSVFEGVKSLIEHESDHHYTVAWIDTTARGASRGRGILSIGDHCDDQRFQVHQGMQLQVPINLPSCTLNRFSVAAFNKLYYDRHVRRRDVFRQSYFKYLYPLDGIRNWNRIYGSRGFFQYQFLLPLESDSKIDDVSAVLDELLDVVSENKAASFLSVLKSFGNISSPGLLSFPRRGITLAMDIPNRGSETLSLLDRLDEYIVPMGGRIYPAKDARMSPKMFRRSYPRLHEFSTFTDPKFSSSFWRRMHT